MVPTTMRREDAVDGGLPDLGRPGVAGQTLKGDEGSWEPEDPWARDPGRVYATAINAVTPETYYRDGSAFRATPK